MPGAYTAMGVFKTRLYHAKQRLREVRGASPTTDHGRWLINFWEDEVQVMKWVIKTLQQKPLGSTKL